MKEEEDPKENYGALMFAYAAHTARKHKRKYEGTLYFYHLQEVVDILDSLCTNFTCDMRAAAYLHDVVEDTHLKLSDLRLFFSSDIVNLVYYLTDISLPTDGNRAARKRIDREHIASGPVEAKNIKLSDIISNANSIIKYDSDFAHIFIPEIKLLVHSLSDADINLLKAAEKVINDYYLRRSKP